MSYKSKQKHREQAGFTLVEIMIALLVFMVIMLGVAAGLLAAIRTNKGNVVRDEALRIAEDELNQLKGQQFTTFGTSTVLASTPAPGFALPAVKTNIRGVPITFAKTKIIADLANCGKRLYEYVNGQTTDPKCDLDIKVVIEGAVHLSSGAGTVTVEIDYAYD